MLAHRRSGVIPPLRRSRQEGETLLELLLTIVLMGIVVVAALTALFTLIRVADRNTKVTTASVLAQSYAEQLKQPVSPTGGPAMAYKACATASGGANPYPAFIGVVPSGYTVRVSEVRALNASAGIEWHTVYEGDFQAPPSSCGWTPPSDGGIQRITIEVTARDVEETLVIVKRNAACPAENFDNADLGPC